MDIRLVNHEKCTKKKKQFAQIPILNKSAKWHCGHHTPIKKNDFFSQNAAQILMNFGSYMHLSKVTQVCSKSRLYDLFSSNYANELLGICVTKYIYNVLLYVTMHTNIPFLTSLNQSTDLLQIFCGCFLGGLLPSLLRSGYYPFFYGILGNFV